MWAPGPKQYEIVKSSLMEKQINVDNLKGIKVMPYIYDMESVMTISDIIISRSGAMTVTEIEKLGKAAIFIPYPYAAENHQEYNARVLEKAGAAKVILDKDLNAQKLNKQIEEIVKDNSAIKEMGQRAKELSINNVEDRIYMEIKEIKLENN